MARIGVLGGGSWGIALAVLLHKNGQEVIVWSALEDEVEALK
ncbi:MAG: glycerol-3-phosphate dehydrogenase, partial [Roseburia sp.]|nr:glycerol-3-phosphate dehydrogenase [Roseburia sp.]